MNNKLILAVIKCGLCLLVSSILFSCASLHKTRVSSKKKIYAQQESSLSFAERRKFDYFFLEAVRLKEKEDLGGAFEMYCHCLEIDPGSAATLFELGKFYMYLGQQKKGEDFLRKAMTVDTNNYWYQETLAGYYRGKGDNVKAVEVIEGMVERFPSRLEPLIALVDLYRRKEDFQKVIHTLDRLEQLDGKSEQISMEKVRMYLAMNNREQAFSEIENLAKEYPYEMRYLTMLGDVYMENGEEEEACATYQRVLQEEPGYAPAMLSMASYYERKGLDSLYRAQLDSLLLNQKIESNTKVNVMRQVILRSERGDRDSTQILRLFHAMLKQEQENADVAMLAAQYLLSKRMDDEAKPVLRQVLEIDPENKPARLQLLSFAISKEDLDEVITLCAPAVEYIPDALEFYYYWGIAHSQKKEYDEALEVLKKGVRQVVPDSDKNMVSDFYSIMGDLYHLKDMNTEAYAAYDSAMVYNANNISVLNNYAYYLSLEKENLDKAEEMSYRTVKAEPTNSTYLDTYAWILFEKGKYAEARIYIDQAMQNGGEGSSVVVEHAGDIYSLNGELEKALEYWRLAEKMAMEQVGEDEETRNEEELNLLRKKIANKKYYAK